MKKPIRNPIKRFVAQVAQRFGYEIRRMPPPNVGSVKPLVYADFLRMYFEYQDFSEFYFVQIGANDGVTNDPLHPFVKEHGLRGLMVEPQRNVFNRLQQNYAGFPGLTFANVAISDQTSLPLYYFDEEFAKIYEEEIGKNATGITSMDREHLRTIIRFYYRQFKGNRRPSLEEIDKWIVTEEVDCLTLDALLETYAVSRVDLLQIDVEGYDAHIVRMVNFDKIRPKIINFEHKHLSVADRLECQANLQSAGYALFNHSGDTCGMLVD
jgi:FkbM family methyltransferase